MKNLIILIITLGSSIYASSQTVNYEVIKNEPVEPKISVNFEFFNMDINTDINSDFSNLRFDNYSMNFGVFGHVKIIDNLEVSFNVHKSWLTLGKLEFKDYPGNTELNGGINFWLTNRTVNRKTKVVLDIKETSKTTTTTYLMVPATIGKRFGFRAGVYTKSGPFNFDDYAGEDITTPFEQTKISSFGGYGGITSRRITNIIIKDKDYGRSFTSIGRDIYLDALIVPINRFKDLNDNGAVVSQTVHAFKTTSPIGFRLGYRTFQVEKKEFTGKKFGVCGAGEIGYKPYQGWFITAGLGITLIKH